MGEQQEAVAKLGLGMAAISYDSPQVLAHFAERKKLRYPLLTDADSKVIDAFGLRNKEVNIDFMKGIPHPGYFLLDGKGRVQAKYFEADYRERITVSDILSGRFPARFKGLEDTVQAKRFPVTAATSAKVVAGGQRIRLTLTLRLPKGLHAYAPGAPSDYIPVSWELRTGQPAKALPMSWPTGKEEKVSGDPRLVPVYEGTVVISREVTMADQRALLAAATEGKLALQSDFRYQACTDRLCYPPETVPVTFSLLVASHDRDRVPEGLRRK